MLRIIIGIIALITLSIYDHYNTKREKSARKLIGMHTMHTINKN